MGDRQDNLKDLITEQSNPVSKSIDKASTLEMLKIIHSEDRKVYDAVSSILELLSKVIDKIYLRMKKGGRLIYFGAGTSGRLGVLDASECPPTFGVSRDLIQGRIAGGYRAITEAVEGAEDSYDLPLKDFEELNINKNDTVLGIAASGRTPYVYGALKEARQLGALTISLVSVENSILSKVSDYCLEVITGPEVITGSTRMKCGTAHKMILNMISTSLMIKSGKTDGNLMVDLDIKNEKLRDRAERIIVACTGCSRKRAGELLSLSYDDVKLAIVMERYKVMLDEARTLLDEADGVLSNIDFIKRY